MSTSRANSPASSRVNSGDPSNVRHDNRATNDPMQEKYDASGSARSRRHLASDSKVQSHIRHVSRLGGMVTPEARDARGHVHPDLAGRAGGTLATDEVGR